MQRSQTRQLMLLMLLGILFIGSGIGLRDPWPADEPRFALVASEMIESGDWLFPRRGGELYPDKPPLFMWTQASFYQLTGSLKIAFLLPGLLAGLLSLFLVWDLARRLWDEQTAQIAAVLLLLAPQFVLFTRSGRIDGFLLAWTSLGLYGICRHLLLGPQRRWLLIGFAGCGLGIITKGVGFLPILLFIPALWIRISTPGQMPYFRPGTDLVFGLVAMFAAVSIWLIPMLIQVHLSGDADLIAYRDNILFKQTGERYVAPSHHFKPWWYFPAEVIPPFWLPIFGLLPWLIPAWKKCISQGDPRIKLLLSWVVLVILFFSLSPAKRGAYILPALPAAALISAPFIRSILSKTTVKRLIQVFCLLLLALMGVVFIYLFWIAADKNAALIEIYKFNLIPTVVIAAIGLLIVLVSQWRHHARLYIGSWLVLWMVYGLWVYPNFDATRSGRNLMTQVELSLKQNQPLALVNWKEQTLLQAQRPTENFGFLIPVEQQIKSAINWLKAHPNGQVLLQRPDLKPCFELGENNYVGLAHRRHWHLVGKNNVTEQCLKAVE